MNRKKIRARGKFPFSKYFQKFKPGEKAAVVRESSIEVNFPKRLQGKTGIVKGERGKMVVMNIKDQNKEKIFLIEPIHLQKIK